MARLLSAGTAAVVIVAGLTVAAGVPAAVASTARTSVSAYGVHTNTDCRHEGRLVKRALRGTDTRVDIDGDGRRDKVAVVTDDDARRACRVFIGVKVRDGHAFSTALDRSAVPPRDTRARIMAMPDLGNDPGAEIVVNTRAKADGALAQLFTLTRGGLERVPMPAFEDGNFYVEGGGVTYPRGASCNGNGAMILSMATLEDNRYEVTRHVYPVRGDALRLVGPRVKVATIRGDSLVDRFPEFGSPHFAACSA